MATIDELVAAFKAAHDLRDRASDAGVPVGMISEVDDMISWLSSQLHAGLNEAIKPGNNETIRMVDQAWANAARKVEDDDDEA